MTIASFYANNERQHRTLTTTRKPKECPMIKALITDLGNVIAPFDRMRSAIALHRAFVPSKSADEIHALINTDASAVKLLEEFETGRISSNEFLSTLEKRLGCALPADTFWPIWCNIFWRNGPVIALWQKAQQYSPGLRLIALSDTDPYRLAWLKNLSGLDFNDAVASFMVGHRKPHESMYQEAVACARRAAGECLFVDDVLQYVEGAREFGLQAHHYDMHDPQRDIKLGAMLGACRLMF
ncbi:MAG: HAD-IA family hydrolase [Patescibacteria group bacterium]